MINYDSGYIFVMNDQFVNNSNNIKIPIIRNFSDSE
jgi:hypothetical protein